MSSSTDRSSNGSQRLLDLSKITKTLQRNKLLWVSPTIVFTLLGLLYAFTKESEWRASQTLIVRDEAISDLGFGNSVPLGRFDNNDSLKRFLETILQVSKNREVLRAALEQVGPPRGKKRSEFPSESHVEAFRDAVSVSAPKGTEFGSSEVVYLSVSATEQTRAVSLATAMCDELDNRMRVLRNEYAKSIIAELTEKKTLAESDLQVATSQLSELESTIGEDLGEMRTLAEGQGGESILQAQLNQIKGELRTSEREQDALLELLSQLQRFKNNTDAILATPNRLLESQPGLRRLKDGLVDAQLRTARLRGGLTEIHPRVQSAMRNERNVEAQLLHEVENAILAIQADISLGGKLMDSLRGKLKSVQNRLDALAGQRAPYVNLTAEVTQRREQVRLASTALAEARGRLEASKTSSLITRVDDPVTGTNPEGPGRTTLLLGSSFAGLAIGLSLVYLIAPWQEARRGRRRTDHGGRRKSDHLEPAKDCVRGESRILEQRSPEAIPPMSPETPTVNLELEKPTNPTVPIS